MLMLPITCCTLMAAPQVIGATSSLTYNVVGHIKTVSWTCCFECHCGICQASLPALNCIVYLTHRLVAMGNVAVHDLLPVRRRRAPLRRRTRPGNVH